MSDQDNVPVDRSEWPNTTSVQMLAGLWRDDPKSWNQMVRLYTPLLLWRCRQGFPRRENLPPLCPVPERDAADVVQEVFLTVFRRIKTFTKDGQPGAFRRWLSTIARYKVLEYWSDPERKFDGSGGSGGRLNDLPDPGPQPDGSDGCPPEHPSETGGGPATKPDLPRLPEPIRHHWCAFWKRYVEKRSAEEVGKELGIPSGEVDRAVSRVLKCLPQEDEDGVPVRVLLLRPLLKLIREKFECRTWDAFWMVAVEGRYTEDVAMELGMTVAAVYTAKSKVLKRLKEELKALGLPPG